MAADLNGDAEQTTLTGYNDWANLRFAFQCPQLVEPPLNAPPSHLPRLVRGPSIEDAFRRGVLFPPRAVELQTVAAASGEVALAVLGTDNLDVGDIDTTSLKLQGKRPIRTEIVDVNGDLRLDLVVVFAGADAAPSPGGRPAHLTGSLVNSQLFVGEAP